jgi:hypothetical protein
MCQSAHSTATAQTKPDGLPTPIQCDKWEPRVAFWEDSKAIRNIGSVACDESVTVLSGLDQMTRVRTQDGKEGYIAGRVLGYVGPQFKDVAPPSSIGAPQRKQSRGDKKFVKIEGQHPDWSPATVEAVMHHQVVVGMNYDMLRASIGNWPLHVNTTYLQGGHTSVQLVYDICNCITDALHFTYFYGYVYLEDGIVTAIQTSR